MDLRRKRWGAKYLYFGKTEQVPDDISVFCPKTFCNAIFLGVYFKFFYLWFIYLKVGFWSYGIIYCCKIKTRLMIEKYTTRNNLNHDHSSVGPKCDRGRRGTQSWPIVAEVAVCLVFEVALLMDNQNIDGAQNKSHHLEYGHWWDLLTIRKKPIFHYSSPTQKLCKNEIKIVARILMQTSHKKNYPSLPSPSKRLTQNMDIDARETRILHWVMMICCSSFGFYF